MSSEVSTLVWIVLWAALLLTLVLLGWRVVRSGIRVFTAGHALIQATAILDAVEPTRDLQRPIPAVLDNRSEVQARWALRRDRRQARQQLRRQDRLGRAKMITSLDPTQRTWPDAW